MILNLSFNDSISLLPMIWCPIYFDSISLLPMKSNPIPSNYFPLLPMKSNPTFSSSIPLLRMVKFLIYTDSISLLPMASNLPSSDFISFIHSRLSALIPSPFLHDLKLLSVWLYLPFSLTAHRVPPPLNSPLKLHFPSFIPFQFIHSFSSFVWRHIIFSVTPLPFFVIPSSLSFLSSPISIPFSILLYLSPFCHFPHLIISVILHFSLIFSSSLPFTFSLSPLYSCNEVRIADLTVIAIIRSREENSEEEISEGRREKGIRRRMDRMEGGREEGRKEEAGERINRKNLGKG